MVDGSMSKPLEGLSTAFLVAMIAGAVALGWLNSRDWLGRKTDRSGDGLSGDDGVGHPHGDLVDHASDGGGHGGNGDH